MVRKFFLFIALIVYLCFALPVFSAAGTNVLFILDASGSMWGQVDNVAKIKTAREALNKLLMDIPKETNLGLLSYGLFSKVSCDDVHYVVSIGANKQKAISDFISKINPKGKTPIAGALKMAGSHLENIKGEKHIVLISDGIETCGGDPCHVAGELTKKGINVKIHVVGFDVADKERKQLECIAKAGGGRYFNADSTAGFKEAVMAVKEEVKVAEAKPEPKPKPKEYFRDDFNGEELGEHWEVLNPNPDGFIVEDGKLLMVSGTAGSMAEETVENMFKLSKKMPKGDWIMTAEFTVDFQTGFERPFIALYQDAENYIEVQAAIAAHSSSGTLVYGVMDLVGKKVSKGAKKELKGRAWNWGDKPSKTGLFRDNAKSIQQPIQLRLTKKGRGYFPELMLAGADEPKWVGVGKFTLLRSKGTLVVGIYQDKKTSAETTASIDWLKIETLE